MAATNTEIQKLPNEEKIKFFEWKIKKLGIENRKLDKEIRELKEKNNKLYIEKGIMESKISILSSISIQKHGFNPSLKLRIER